MNVSSWSIRNPTPAILFFLLLTLAGLIGAGGLLSVRDHRAGLHIEAEDAGAVAAAKDCVVATQVPASPDLVAAEQKILDCSTGEFRTQALGQSGVFLRMYEAAKVHVSLDEVRAAVESHNADGTVDVLVAFRVNVDDLQSRGRKVSSRLRAQMQFDEGAYRIARLDPVTK